MYSKPIKLICILLFYSGAANLQAMPLGTPNDTKTTEVNLALKVSTSFHALPAQCVTLREGRDCFAEVTMHWQSQHKQSLCLYQEGLEQHLGCWHDNNTAHIAIEFISNKNVNYQLRTAHNNVIVAETEVTVSWLHKGSTRKRRWRLF